MNPSEQSTHALPVVLVHGFWNTHSYLGCMAKRLRKKGWKVYNELDLPNDGKVPLEILAQQLAAYIFEKIGDSSPFHLVGFSMGGLVARYFTQYLDERKQVKSLVTLATPHHGTWRAYTFNRIGCIQMRPHSDFLNKMNSDIHLLAHCNVTSIWAKYDTIILPNKSASLPVGREVILSFGIHPLLPFSKRVLEEVEDSLK